MLRNHWLEILAVVTVLAYVGVFLATTVMNPTAEFAGSDTRGSQQISQITGIPEGDFRPLIPQWVPPSGEIESALFALQAAVGGIVLGYVFGSWRAQRRYGVAPTPAHNPDTNV
jgi:cobalt/nickel transport protein